MPFSGSDRSTLLVIGFTLLTSGSHQWNHSAPPAAPATPAAPAAPAAPAECWRPIELRARWFGLLLHGEGTPPGNAKVFTWISLRKMSNVRLISSQTTRTKVPVFFGFLTILIGNDPDWQTPSQPLPATPLFWCMIIIAQELTSKRRDETSFARNEWKSSRRVQHLQRHSRPTWDMTSWKGFY